MDSQTNGLSSIDWLVMNAPLFSIIFPLIPHFEYGRFTLAQTIWSLKIGQAISQEFEL